MNNLVINVANILSQLGAELELKGEKKFSPILTSYRELKFAKPVKFDLKVRNVGNALLVKGTFLGKLTLPCSRCLEPFSYSSRAEVEEVFRATGEENFRIAQGTIDLGPLAEQAIVVNLPVKTLCKEDCRGLCPYCGQNLNKGKCDCKREQTDLRFSKLKDLLRKE